MPMGRLECTTRMVRGLVCFRHTVLMSVVVCVCGYLAYIGSELILVPECVRSLQIAPVDRETLFSLQLAPARQPGGVEYRGCNGDVELCGRRYSEVSYACMHNAFSTSQDGMLIAQHRGCMRTALVKGVRAFMLDVHLTSAGAIKLCHATCTVGLVSVSTTMDMFSEFLKLNPREIITIMWELGYDQRFEGQSVQDSERIRLKTLLASAYEEAGLTPYLFVMSQSWPWLWPTLEQMIRDNTRLVTFSSSSSPADKPWDNNLAYFSVQTPYDSTDRQQLRAQCVLPQHHFTPLFSLLIINHFTTFGAGGVNTASTSVLGEVLNVEALRGINRSPFMAERLMSCAKCLGKFANFIAVDFWESSDVIEVVALFNGVPLSARARYFHTNTTFCV